MTKTVGLLAAMMICMHMCAADVDLSAWMQVRSENLPKFPTTYVAPKGGSESLVRNSLSFEAEEDVARRSLPDSTAARSWKRIVDAQGETLSVATIQPTDGVTWSFAVYNQLGNLVPYYWTGIGYPATAAPDVFTASVEQAKRILGTTAARSRIMVATNVVTKSDIEITMMDGTSLAVPFERGIFVFVDDRPGANWAHPCRYVFFSEDLSAFAVSYQLYAPRIRRVSSGERLWLKAVEGAADVVPLKEITDKVYSAANAMSSGGTTGLGDVSRSHFVLISGGGDPENNGIRFWADTAMLYSTFTRKYGVPKSQIHVLMSDGGDPAEDANLNNFANPVLVDSPADLDGDGVSDVDGAVTWANMNNVFTNTLAKAVTADSQVFVFIVSHGSADGTAGVDNHSCFAYLYSTAYSTVFSDVALANMTKNLPCPVAFAIETCYSGGFIDDLTATPDRVVLTACDHYESSLGTGGQSRWGSAGAGSTCAYDTWAVALAAAVRECWSANYNRTRYVFDFPWSNGAIAASDANDDGLVSMEEAFAFARENDECCCTDTSHTSCHTDDSQVEHPQFAESTVGLGARFWVLKQSGGDDDGRPANDDFANAVALVGASGQTTGSNVRATKQDGEPLPKKYMLGTNTVWWTWVAPSAGTASFSTAGTGFDTVMGVYTGDDLSLLEVVKEDDDGGADRTSVCTFDCVSGRRYYIAVAGCGSSAVGTIMLNWKFSGTGTTTTYSINYALGTGGTHGMTHPASVPYGMAFYVSAPSRSGYTFAGWTVTSGLNTSTAKWGTTSNPSTAIGSSSTKCVNGAAGNVYFKNLTPTANGSVTLTANWAAASEPKTLYVEMGGSDTGRTGTDSSQPLATITRAIALAVAGDTIIVGDGCYSPFNAYQKPVTIRSVNGPEKTVIQGNGTATCAYLNRAENPATLIGFTLTNGYNAASGGGVSGGIVRNCILTGNHALYAGGGAYNSTLYNCRLVNNSTEKTGGGGAISCTLYNCTIVGNSGKTGGGTHGCTLYNCIVWGNTATSNPAVYDSTCTSTYTGTENPGFVNAATGDYRLASGSVCIDAGFMFDWMTDDATDLDGNPRVVGDVVDMGAYEWQGSERPDCMVTLIKGAGVGSIYYRIDDEDSWTLYRTPISVTAGTVISYYATPSTGYTSAHTKSNPMRLTVDSTMTDQLLAAPNKYFITYALNEGTFGMTHPTNATYDAAFSVSAPTRTGCKFVGWAVTSGLVPGLAKWGTSSSPSMPIVNYLTKCVNGETGDVYFKNLTTTANGSVTLTANWERLSAEPVTFYVATGGSDEVMGTDENAPLATIQRAVDLSLPGDRVLVGPGVYAPIVTQNKDITIESASGPSVTIIDGGGSRRCATLAEGAGGHLTVLRGFTLTNGRVSGMGAIYGGGAYGGTLDRCIVSNCTLMGTSLQPSSAYGGGVAYSRMLNSLIVHNTASGRAAFAGAYSAEMENCTVTGNRAIGTTVCGGASNGSAESCIILGNMAGETESDVSLMTLTYCCIGECEEDSSGCLLVDPRFVDAANGNYRLAEGSPCIDAGSPAAGLDALDLDGLSRVVNGRIDIGAYEWREMARPDAPTGVSVTNGESVDISWNAVEGATSYSVWRAATNDSSKAQQIATVTDTSYADSAPAYYSQNYYWVKAVNDAGSSGFSNSDCGYRYQANTYLLKYDANGGIGTMSDEILSTQGDSYLTKCAFTRVGYAFIGWATSPTGSSRYSEGDSTWWIAASQGSIVTLYAVWCAYDAEGFVIVNGVLRGYNGPGGDVVVPDTVRQIRADVFAGNTSLTSVVLPSSVGFFGHNEFRGCTGLTNVVLGAWLTGWASAFTDCPNVTSAVIPGDSFSANLSSTFPKLVYLKVADGSPSVTYGLCSGCTMLKKVVVPEGVSELGDRAFENCANLVHVELPQSVVRFGRGVFDGCPKLQLKFDLVIPDGTTWVQTSAYEGLTFITSVSLPGGYLSIQDSAFKGCTGITNLIFRGSVSSIGARAFAGCTGLRELALTNAFASVSDAVIYGEAFLGCNGLTHVTIPEGIRLIDTRAFGNCANLVSATVLSTDCYMSGVFKGCGKFTDLSVKLPTDGFTLASNLDGIADNLLNLTILPDATELPMRSLYNCRNVRTLTLPEGMTSIGASAAWNCTSLEKVVFPSTLKVVGSGAFMGCTNLSEANLPQGLQVVGSYAFSGSKISHPRIPDSVSDILWKAFGDVDLSDWTIDSGNPYLAVDSGLLYNVLDGSRFRVLLASRQIAGKIELPASVTELQDYAFDGCVQISEVIVPEGVVRMGSEVFANCTGLTAVRFLGNRPVVGPYMGQIEEDGEDLYSQAADSLTSYVRRDKSGWTDETTGELPGDWQERPIAFWDETPVSTDVPVAVEHKWLEERWEVMRKAFPGLPETPNFESFAIAAKMPTGKVDARGNPMYVWQDFVAGTDPTDKASEFKASISFVDGKPVITWTPDLNEGGTKALRTYRTLGISDLSQSADPAAWHEVTPGNESAYKFFKVEVGLK